VHALIVVNDLIEASGNSAVSFYLMKAEPDSRVVKGKDVKVRVFFNMIDVLHLFIERLTQPSHPPCVLLLSLVVHNIY
jgi:hypothetical protein